jgi:hypothetical protein
MERRGSRSCIGGARNLVASSRFAGGLRKLGFKR